MTPTGRRIAWGGVAGGACAELLLLAAVGRAPVPLPTWIALVVVGALLGGLVTLVATRGAHA